MSVVDDHEAALSRLDALKAVCRERCDDASAAVAAIPDEARAKAVVAHHVITHGPRAIVAAYRSGPAKFLEQSHLDEVARVSDAVAAGADPAEAAGADPAHVAALEAARAAHADHGDELATAYADLARTSAKRAAAGV